jgi:protease-4
MWLLAGASDECFALETSVVGSIGVVAPSFGAVGALSRLGLERRVMKAGAAKAGADPFTPLSEEERGRIQSILDDLHSTFISAIKKSRGAKIEQATEKLKKLAAGGGDGGGGGGGEVEESRKRPGRRS